MKKPPVVHWVMSPDAPGTVCGVAWAARVTVLDRVPQAGTVTLLREHVTCKNCLRC